MRTIITSPKDIKFLQGKFVIQINTSAPDNMIWDFDWEFVKQKRLYMICGHSFCGTGGSISTYPTFDEFKNVFNEYRFKHTEDDGAAGKRFYRLLTSKEIDYVCDILKSENF